MTLVVLSSDAVNNLRITLRKSYGADFDVELTDEHINSIGVLILTSLVESLKLEMIQN